MRSKIFKSIVATFALVVSMVVMASTVVEAEEYAVTPTAICLNETMHMASYIGDEFIDGYTHRHVEDRVYTCASCGYSYTETETYTEDHNYSYNSSAGQWECVCGDSFSYYY